MIWSALFRKIISLEVLKNGVYVLLQYFYSSVADNCTLVLVISTMFGRLRATFPRKGKPSTDTIRAFKINKSNIWAYGAFMLIFIPGIVLRGIFTYETPDVIYAPVIKSLKYSTEAWVVKWRMLDMVKPFGKPFKIWRFSRHFSKFSKYWLIFSKILIDFFLIFDVFKILIFLFFNFRNFHYFSILEIFIIFQFSKSSTYYFFNFPN